VSKFLALYRRELAYYFQSPVAYAVVAVFLLFGGYSFYNLLGYFNLLSIQVMQNPLQARSLSITASVLAPLFSNMSTILLLILPLLTMRLFAEERRSGSAELLFTYPVSDTSIIAGKFVAAVTVLAVMLAMTVPYVALLALFASPEPGPVISGYLGVLLMGVSFVAMGTFFSALGEPAHRGCDDLRLRLLFLVIGWIAPFVSPVASVLDTDHRLYLEGFARRHRHQRPGLLRKPHRAFLFLSARALDSCAGGVDRDACGLPDCHCAGAAALWPAGRSPRGEPGAPRGRSLAAGAVFSRWSPCSTGRCSHSAGSRRAARRGRSRAFFIAVLAVVQATSVRRSHLFDLTRNQRNTLAPQTVALLDSLDREVTATAFFRQDSPARAGAGQLMGLYARLSPRFRFRLVDPDRHPELVEQLGANADEIVVEAGGARRIARAAGEDALTNALLQVTRTGAKTVYFLTGHGERSLDLTSSDGFSAARAGLESQGYTVRPLSLLGLAAVPEDAAVVVIAGPPASSSIGEPCCGYLAAGGSSRWSTRTLRSAPGPAEFRGCGRRSRRDRARNRRSQVRRDGGKIRRYERHPITRGFNFVTMFPRARRITADSAGGGLDARYLCVTDGVAWGGWT
jgi:ABC-2 type transport system permease protein